MHRTFTDRLADILCAVALVVFVILKWPHLSLPFFWDETGVYAKMVFDLSDTGLSLHPAALNEWISRGHPLLYPNMIAAVTRIFGETVTIAHAANFAISCGWVVSIFWTLRQLYTPWVGLMAAVFLMFHPLFFAQSVFVLPEVALSFMIWWATWAFIQRKYLLYILTGTAAVLIKEPAIVWLGALCAWDLVQFRKFKWWTHGVWAFPLVVFGLFLVIQKQVMGWYLFPYHSGKIDLQIAVISDQGWDYLQYIFWKQGRWLFTLILMMTGLMLLAGRSGKVQADIPRVSPRIGVVLWASLVYLIFSSTTFYHDRYILPILGPVCAWIAYLTFYFIGAQYRYWAMGAMLIWTALSFSIYHTSDKFNWDLDMSYTRSIISSKKTIQYMVENGMMDDYTFTATIPILYATIDERFGYMPPGVSARFQRAIFEGSKYAVKVTPGSEIENPENYPLELIREWYDHDIKTQIYKVLPKDTLSVQSQ